MSKAAATQATDRPTGELVERLLRISDNAMASIAEQSVAGVTLADANTIDQAATHITTLEAEIARLQAAMREAVEATGWYASNVGNCRKLHLQGDIARKNLDADAGKRAREAHATLTTLLSDAPEGEGEQS